VFVGHALLAFAATAATVRSLGRSRERALALGAAAAGFAAVPDVDVVYALVGLAGALGDGAGALAAAGAFWATSSLVHRAVTHSLVVAPVAALAAAAWASALDRPVTTPLRQPGALAAVGLLAGLAVVGLVRAGPLAALVTAGFALALVGVASLAARIGGLGPRAVLVTALVGLCSHPFGDLVTGAPPAMLYPFEAALVTERLTLHPDPTVHLLAAFGLELATVWLAAAVLAGLDGRRLLPAPRASLGAGYAGALPLVPAPTLELSYPFVFSVLAVGTVALVPLGVGATGRGPGPLPAPLALSRPRVRRALPTALWAVTAAWAAYAVAYIALAPG
jgi:membrane-bound metal-dependent hydrolase YbcI (DUF457 family)